MIFSINKLINSLFFKGYFIFQRKYINKKLKYNPIFIIFFMKKYRLRKR